MASLRVLMLMALATVAAIVACGGDSDGPPEELGSTDIHPCFDSSLDMLGVQPSLLRGPTSVPGATPAATSQAPDDGSGFGSGVPGCDGPDFSQRCALWGSDEYDHGRAQDIGCGSNIAQCGCAMSSAASLLLRHGVTRGPDGQPTTPRTLNEWLKRDPRQTQDGILTAGYTFGAVNWLAVAQYSKLASERFGTPALSFAGSLGPDSAGLRREVENGRPVILEQPGHFILATGASSSSIAIADPFYGDRTSLDTPAYRNTFVSGRLYRASPDASAMMIAAPRGVQFRLQDAGGNVTGMKAGAPSPVNEIRQSTFSRESAWRDPTCTAAPPRVDAGVDMAILWQPGGGKYRAEVFGDAGDKYSLAVYAYDQAGGLTLRPFDGVLPASGSVVVNIDYTPAAGGRQGIELEGTTRPATPQPPTPQPGGQASSPTPTRTATLPPPARPASPTPTRTPPPTRTPTPAAQGKVATITLSIAPSSFFCNDVESFAIVTATARDAGGKLVPTPIQFSATAGKITPGSVMSSTGEASARLYPGMLAAGTTIQVSATVPGIVPAPSATAGFLCRIVLMQPVFFPVN